MAKPRNGNDRKVSFEEVIQCSLFGKELDKVVGYIATADALLDMTETLLLLGYEVSHSYNPKHKNYSVCLKGVREDCTNAGLWLYGNADDLLTAYAAVYFKHFEVYESGRWVDRVPEGKGGIS